MDKNLLILSLSPLHKDPRVLRQINWLKDEYKITTVGLTPSKIEGLDHVNYTEAASPPLKKLRRILKLLTKDYDSFYWRDEKKEIVEKLRGKKFSKIIANDFDTLPMAFALAGGGGEDTKILFDAHEYAPQHLEDQWEWRLLVQPIAQDICRKFIPKVDAASTVCQSIAEKYEENFGRKFALITNAPDYAADLSPTPVNADKIRMIYHGVASESRETDKQIEMMKFLDKRYELNLMIIGQDSYINKLKNLARGFENIKFLPPVETREIPRFTNQFDIGLFLLPPTNTNYQYALPNKFFEYIQARLAIAIGPSVEMSRVVKKYDLGVVADDFTPQSMAKTVEGMSVEKINYYKSQSHKYAYELSADSNREKFLEMVNS